MAVIFGSDSNSSKTKKLIYFNGMQIKVDVCVSGFGLTWNWIALRLNSS